MVAKDNKKTTGSPKVEVGEIDTSAPFQSVKDAVNLFGEGAFSGEKPIIKKTKPYSAERVFAKETQLHLAQKELNKLKEQLKNAETTKDQALAELERAQRTVVDLTDKLKKVSESKDLATEATEAAKNEVKQIEGANNGISKENDGFLKQDVKTEREKYLVEIAELDAAKQELRSIHHYCDGFLEAKSNAIKKAEEAEQTAKANKDRVGELSEEIAAIQESIGQLATMQSEEEEVKICANEIVEEHSLEASLERTLEKLQSLKTDFDPQLAATMSEIECLEKQMDHSKALGLSSLRMVTSELGDAKESLHKVAEEESSLCSLVESLQLELENVKKEHSELKEKGAQTESITADLHVKIRKAKHQLDVALAEESQVRDASEEMLSTLHQLISESANARLEVEEMKKQAEELKKVAESTRILLEEAEKKLRAALEEAEEAKAAEAMALEQIRSLSERTDAARSSMSESGGQVRIPREEFESLSRKVEETEKLAEMKVGAAMAQVEAVKASENEALKKLEATQKEVDGLKSATQEALKRAELAEAAKKAVEGELRRWREREQKKISEAASRTLAENEMSAGLSSYNYPVQKPNQPEYATEMPKLEKVRTSVSKKVLVPNLTSIFHRKKNQVVGSPSYLPGEKPV